MKKLFMTLIASLVLCGSIYAQDHPDTHYPDFNHHDYLFQASLYASILIDGEAIDINTPDHDMLEVCAFIYNEDGEEVQRSYGMWLFDDYVIEWGELFPTLNADAIFYTEGGDIVHFKMHNHATGMDYTATYGILWDDGAMVTVITGEDHWEGFDDPDHPLMLNFISSESDCITKDIEAYTGNKDHYYLISSPIGAVSPMDVENMIKIADDIHYGYDLYYFDQTKELEWIHYVDQENGGYELQTGKGYLYANDETVTLSFCGEPYTGSGEVTLLKNEDASTYFKGWNLIGNPFATAATVPDAYSFYVMGEEGELVTAERNYAEAMEGIFVIAETDGEVLTFTPENRVNTREMLSINLGKGRSLVDRAIVRFDESRTLPKFQLNTASTKLYFPVDNSEYAVVRSEGMGELPLNFKASENGAYTMSFTNSNVEFSYLHLIDNMTGDDVNLLETPGYTFEAKKTDFATRFRLVFATGSSANNDNFGFVNTSGNLCIYGIDGEATLQVVDVTGRILCSETFSGSYEKHLEAAPGVYMLRLINGNDMKVQKIVLN